MNKVQRTMNATVVTGEYIDKATGQQKKSYLTIGKLFIYANGGMSLKLDALPMHGQSINFYDIKPKNQPRGNGNNNNYGGNGHSNNYGGR